MLRHVGRSIRRACSLAGTANGFGSYWCWTCRGRDQAQHQGRKCVGTTARQQPGANHKPIREVDGLMQGDKRLWGRVRVCAACVGKQQRGVCLGRLSHRAPGRAPSKTEAASAIGLRLLAAMCLVILPQAWRHALPAQVGETVSLFKLTSLAAAIGVAELTYEAPHIVPPGGVSGRRQAAG